MLSLDASGKPDALNGGAIGGKLGERPRVVYRASDNVGHDYVAGKAGLMNLPELVLYSWAEGARLGLLRQAGDESLFTSEVWSVGDTFFWNNGDLRVSRQKVWSPSVPT